MNKIVFSGFGLAMLLVANTSNAQASKDPRVCLYANPASSNAVSTQKEEIWWGVPVRQIDNCFAQENWPIGLKQLLKVLLEYNYRKKIHEEYFANARINLAPMENYFSGRDEKNLGSLVWATIDTPIDRNLLSALEAANARKFTEEEKVKLQQYVRYRANVELRLLSFARGLGQIDERVLSERWQILPAIEGNRPRIVPRTLSRAEQNLSKKLSAEYIRTADTQTSDRLIKMTELAQSGDKIAMIALRDALVEGPPWDVEKHYLSLNIFNEPLRSLTSVLAAQWTAQIWHIHGYEDAGRKAMSACINGIYGAVRQDREKYSTARLNGNILRGVNYSGQLVDDSSDVCGFSVTAAFANSREGGFSNGKLISNLPRGATLIPFYDVTGSGWPDKSRDYYVTGIVFNPILGDATQREQKYQSHLMNRKSGLVIGPDGQQKNFTTTMGIAYAYYQKYATETGRLKELEDADAGISAIIKQKNAAEVGRKFRRWNELVEKYKANASSVKSGELDEMQYLASSLGLWNDYTKLVPNRYGNSAVQSSTSVSYSGGSNSQNQRVQVRTYDSGGNYTGSLTTSAVWADIMKMSSGPPR